MGRARPRADAAGWADRYLWGATHLLEAPLPATRTARASLLPLLLLATGTASRCELSTDAGTGELHLRGTIRFLEAEAGCWQLETDDGRRYELLPEQAPASVLHDGARVLLVAHPSGEPARACRSAMPVEVRRVMSVEGV